MNKNKLGSDKDLEKLKKNTAFIREEKIDETILNVQCYTIKIIPCVLAILFVLSLFDPDFIKNKNLLNQAINILGGGILGSILSKVKRQK